MTNQINIDGAKNLSLVAPTTYGHLLLWRRYIIQQNLIFVFIGKKPNCLIYFLQWSKYSQHRDSSAPSYTPHISPGWRWTEWLPLPPPWRWPGRLLGRRHWSSPRTASSSGALLSGSRRWRQQASRPRARSTWWRRAGKLTILCCIGSHIEFLKKKIELIIEKFEKFSKTVV